MFRNQLRLNPIILAIPKNCLLIGIIAVISPCVLASTAQAQGTPATWRRVETVNQMTDEHAQVMKANSTGVDGAKFEVTAECTNDGKMFVDFKSANELALLQQYSQGSGMHCDTIEYAIDKTAYSYIQDSCEGNTHAVIGFLNPEAVAGQSSQMTKEMLGGFGMGALGPLVEMFQPNLVPMLKTSNPIGLADLLSAPVLRIGLMVTSGEESVVKLDLTGKEIHDFIGRCYLRSGGSLTPHAPPVTLTNGLAVPEAADAQIINSFVRQLPGLIDQTSCQSGNGTCGISGNARTYAPEGQTLRDTLTTCASLSPEIAAAVPENYIRKKFPQCFAAEVSYGIYFLTPNTPESHNLDLPRNWLGVHIVPAGSLRDGGGFTFDITMGTKGNDDPRDSTLGHYGLNSLRYVSRGNHLPQYHSSPEQVARVLATVPPPPLPPLPPARTVALTHSEPELKGSVTATAPGSGLHRYVFVPIDLSAYPTGGTLTIEADVDRNSRTAVSFDLFKGDANVPAEGRLGRLPLTGVYDVEQGKSAHLQYRFSSGQSLKLGIEGNWASKYGGETGNVTYRIKVSH